MGARSRFVTILICLAIVAAACTTSGDTTTTTATTTTPAPVTTSAQPAAPPPEPAPIVPMLRATGGGDLHVGQPLSLTAQVLAAESVTRLELWVDGSNVATREFAEAHPDPTMPFDWTADSVGLHVAEIRAFDESGDVAASAPLWFRIDAGWDPVSGDVLDGLPQSPLLSPSAGVDTDPASCSASVRIPSAADSRGQAVTATTFGYGGRATIAVVGAAGGEVTVPMTAAPVIVTVQPYNDAAGIAAPSVVPGAAGCGGEAWGGDVGFDGTILQGGDSLEAVYLYVNRDDSTWIRVPETGFVNAGPAGFDFAGLVPPVDPDGHLEVEAWGWGQGRLEALGRGRIEGSGPTPATEPGFGQVQPVQPYSDLNIVRFITEVDSSKDPDEFLLLEDVLCVEGIQRPNCGPRMPTLRWNTNLLGAEAGLIQVSSARPPEGPATDFPGLMWSTMVALDESPVRDFQLAMVDIYAGTAPSGAGRATGLRQFDPGWFEFADLEAMGVELFESAAPAAADESPRMTQPVMGRWWREVPPSRMWVRVIPFTNSRPIAGTSNAVLFEIDGENAAIEPPPEQVFDSLYEVEVDFRRPLDFNDAYSHCVRVVENKFGADNPAPAEILQAAYDAVARSARVHTADGAASRGLVPGATVCAFKPDPPDKGIFDYVGEAISFVGEAWDTFKDLVDMVKGGIIQGIVDITGCKPEATCVAALNALADAGLAAIGVPPSMPSFKELMKAAKGDIAAALTEALAGQVCEGPCAEFAAKFVEDALDDIEQHFSELATAQAQSGGWVLFLNPEIRVIPEPAGQLFPGSVEATITRTPDGELNGSRAPTTCYVSVQTHGAGPLSWTTKQGDSIVDKAVSGPVFAPETISVDLTKLARGESVTVGVASLDFDRWHYLTGTGPGLTGYSSQERLQSLELWVDPDTTFTMDAFVCAKSFSREVSKRRSRSPGEIPTP